MFRSIASFATTRLIISRPQFCPRFLTNMTTDSTVSITITSPPNSPPAKRVKTNTTHTMADSTANGSATVPITKIDQAPPLLIKKLSDKARVPTRGSAFAAGYDLYAARETTIPARGKALVDTDISMAVPAGTCMFPFPSHHRV